MGLEDKKQELNREGGPQKSAEKEAPSPKGYNAPTSSSHPDKSGRAPEKKDASILGGKPDMDTEKFMYELKDPNLYSKTNLAETRRTELGKKIFGGFGTRIDHGEIENAKTELGKGKWGKYKDLSHQDKIDAERLIRGLEHLGE